MTHDSTRWKVYQWQQPIHRACWVLKAIGLAIVTWPSGHTTLEMISGTIMITDLEVWHSAGELQSRKEESLLHSLDNFAERMVRLGFLIRTNKTRQKPRRIVAIEWFHPDRAPRLRHTGPGSIVEVVPEET